MSTHVVATCAGAQTTLEVVEDCDFFASRYSIVEQPSGRVLREGISSRRSALAEAEAAAAAANGMANAASG